MLLLNRINKTTANKNINEYTIEAALGPTWAHTCKNRFMLSWHNNVRVCELIKSACYKPQKVYYTINEHGIRDVPQLQKQIDQNIEKEHGEKVLEKENEIENDPQHIKRVKLNHDNDDENIKIPIQ